MAANGKKLVMLIEQDFEDVEVSEPLKAFRNAGIQVTVVGKEAGLNYTGKQKKFNIRADTTPDRINVREYDGIFIPGGYAPDKMRLHPPMIDLVKKFNAAGKLITAICHGPQLLISAGLARDKRMTSWPSVAIDLKNAGATYVDEPVVIDATMITSRMPEDIPQFTEAVIQALEQIPALVRS
jgi:protease I